jgi:nucleoside-diphosphate-sugar epimerase
MTVFTPTREELAVFKFPSADIIIHAAGYAQPEKFMADPLNTIKVNTDLTRHLFSALNPGGTFLFCSSTEVYSGFPYSAMEEDIGTTTPQHPRAAYIEGKRCGEAIVEAFRRNGVKASSARIATVYGPGTQKSDSRALNQFIEQALTQKRITLRDKGDAVRTLCYVSDMAEMLWSIALRGTQSVYNVGGTTVTSIWQLAQKIAEKTGAELVIPDHDTISISGPREVHVDLTRIRNEFGKTEYISLDDGLDKTIAYQRGIYEA